MSVFATLTRFMNGNVDDLKYWDFDDKQMKTLSGWRVVLESKENDWSKALALLKGRCLAHHA